jgi:hypothetical protein
MTSAKMALRSAGRLREIDMKGRYATCSILLLGFPGVKRTVWTFRGPLFLEVIFSGTQPAGQYARQSVCPFAVLLLNVIPFAAHQRTDLFAVHQVRLQNVDPHTLTTRKLYK